MTVWEIAPGVVDQFTALGRTQGPDIRFPSHITTTTDIFWTETVYKNRLEYSERVGFGHLQTLSLYPTWSLQGPNTPAISPDVRSGNEATMT